MECHSGALRLHLPVRQGLPAGARALLLAARAGRHRDRGSHMLGHGRLRWEPARDPSRGRLPVPGEDLPCRLADAERGGTPPGLCSGGRRVLRLDLPTLQCRGEPGGRGGPVPLRRARHPPRGPAHQGRPRALRCGRDSTGCKRLLAEARAEHGRLQGGGAPVQGRGEEPAEGPLGEVQVRSAIQGCCEVRLRDAPGEAGRPCDQHEWWLRI
mmetsp:Transcript_38041/g.112982  ORF Transcript_38041/g.112982 Transcript_38041/m.112982 type:complete len:212 (+) Transcript_38041:1127-1762(+)